jgi:aquaporin Z
MKRAPALEALAQHWPEYLMEAAELGLFMISACAFGVLLEHPSSPVRQAIPDAFVRRALMGLAMGGTAIAIIFSPLGKQSGGHFNPSVTLTFLRLGKIKPWDASFYILAQFAGGIAGVLLAATLLRQTLTHPAVNYVATLPGPSGAGPAFLAEAGISFVLMTVVLHATNAARFARFTGFFAGALVALYITFEAPISGMSMNPARTFGSAVAGNIWNSLWIYFVAPPLGMLLAAEAYRRPVGCAKLHHQNHRRCIHCGYGIKQNQPTKGEVPCIAR